MTLRPVGVVRSAIAERKAMPPLGGPASIEIYPEFAGALLRIEKHSHLWVLGWLDRGERDVLRVTPRGVADRGPGGLHGVFAVRSPARPNPVGLTACRVVSFDGPRIAVDRLDFLDGTPVIDVKPYFVTRDAINSANNAPIGKSRDREALRESLLLQAEHFHGEMCTDLALAVRMVENCRAAAWDLGEPERWSVEVPLGRPCLIDAIMGMTRATPGRGTMRFTSGDAVTLGERTYLAAAGGRTASEILVAPEDTLFRLA